MNHEHQNDTCPLVVASNIVGDKWSLIIIYNLMQGCMRFNTLQSAIGDITSSTLSERLKRLVDINLVERHQFESIPPKVEYSLTKKGKLLIPVINSLKEFGEILTKS